MRDDSGRSPEHALRENPFAITKAVDFTDSEIHDTWVDWPAPGGFAELLSIKSPMARIISGGKGTGRTHIMRHYSAPVQVIRGGQDTTRQVILDGMLGIYVPCSGLNASRFRDRGLPDDTWMPIFVHYADVWLAQAAIAAFETAIPSRPPSMGIQQAITNDVRELLPGSCVSSGTSLVELRNDLHDLQRRIDLAVSRAAIEPGFSLDISIDSAPGSLVFGIPSAMRSHYKPFADVTYVYLIDEFENFNADQQKYVNSLVRERKPGISFMVGVRTFGLRTRYTLNAKEENRRGSEFDEIRLDKDYSRNERNHTYESFCNKMVARRLFKYDYANEAAVAEGSKGLGNFFEAVDAESEEFSIVNRYADTERPYLQRLKRQLLTLPVPTESSVLAPREVDFIIDALRVPFRPLLEKVNVLLIYRAWARRHNLVDVARDIVANQLSPDLLGVVWPNEAQRRILLHYSTDLYAQLQGRHIYAGINTFINMSGGLPRNLLVILKNVYRWALFNGERPFDGGIMSIAAQQAGVREAANWFFADAKPIGEDGQDVHDAIHRLGEMFRNFRFADKPVESSLVGFSADLTSCSKRSREVVELADQSALLVHVEKGQKERNTGLVEAKFQLNRLLSPRWDLPIARRGVIRLNADEMNAIFDPEMADEFKNVVGRRLERMNAPFGRQRFQSLQETFSLDDEPVRGQAT